MQRFIRFQLTNSIRCIIVIMLLVNCNKAKSQFHPLHVDANINYPTNPGLYQINLGSNQSPFFRIGSGFPNLTQTEYPKFHIRTQMPTLPLLQLDGLMNDGYVNGSLQFLFLNPSSSIQYGIYQSGTDFTNFFEGSLGCNSYLYFNGEKSAINIATSQQFPIIIRSSPSSPAYTVMELSRQKVKVQDTMECNNFLMHYNAGLGKVLVSDQYGNGNWINPASFIDNMWSRNSHGEIFTLDNVGIGSEDPQDKFQVNDGINKVVMGIGTSNIYDKESSSEQKKNPIGVAKEDPRMINSALGYLGFNMVNTHDGWLVSGDGEHNYGSSIFHDFRGSMHFCVIPDSEGEEHGDRVFNDYQMNDKIKMSISSYGFVGIGTRSPIEQLDVETDNATFIRAASNSDKGAGFKFVNSNGIFSIGVDQDGKGKIWEAGIGNIMSFRSSNFDFAGNIGVAGKVGIGAVDLTQYANSTSKLFVEGGITTEAVHVKLHGSGWSDFVFADDYKIRSLSELDKFIKTNKHLPDVPTSSDIETEGIDLGKMNALLLQKIEELTMYVIDQQKQIDLLKQLINR